MQRTFSKTSIVSAIILVALATATLVHGKGPAYTNPRDADDDFAIQGEYLGSVSVNGEEHELGLQLIAQGKGTFRLARFLGGLPGAGWNGEALSTLDGAKAEDGTVTFQGRTAKGVFRDGVIEAFRDGELIGTMKKTKRKSPTQGQEPPAGAIVLFDGSSADEWKGGKLEKKLLIQGTNSKKEFQSQKLHIEFRLPYQPEDSGQQRGNSGLYLQGRYEVQMLDSFGLEGKDNECGGIYSIKDPDVNMCLPPLSWQTYDVDFVAAEYDDEGKVIKHPRMTVRHNGVLIHKNVELPKSTTAAPMKPGPTPGPIYLQNHGNPIRYRNIWVVPTS